MKKQKIHTIQYSTRVMHAFKAMSEERISALPIVGPANVDNIKESMDESKYVLKGEFSLHSMQHLSHDSLQLILGSVSSFLHATDPQKKFSSPLSCSRRDTLKQVLTQMHVAKRTHVWCVTKKNTVKGVISLSDVMKLLFQ